MYIPFKCGVCFKIVIKCVLQIKIVSVCALK